LQQQYSKFAREKSINFPKAVPKEKDLLGLLNNLKKRAKTFEWKSDVETAHPKLKPDRIVGLPTEIRQQTINLDSDDSDFELEVVQYIGDEEDTNELPLTQRFRGDSDDDLPSTQQPDQDTSLAPIVTTSQTVSLPKLRIETQSKSWEEDKESKTPTSGKSNDSMSFNGFETRGYRMAMLSKIGSVGTPNAQNSSQNDPSDEEEEIVSENEEEKNTIVWRRTIRHVAKKDVTPTTPVLSSMTFDTDRFEMVDNKRKRKVRNEQSSNAAKFAKEYYTPNQNGIKKIGAMRLTKKKGSDHDED
jgi:hypothetical protein